MSTSHRRPVTFTNRHGVTLFGILETPADRPAALAAILLSPGVKMRVGPECVYRRLADQLVRAGVAVLRFDFYGLGDSQGTLNEELLRDIYNHTEVGRFVEDTVDAMDWMERHCGARRFLLAGLCGGAITGLLAGGRDRRVAGLIGLGITPVLAAASANASLYMTAGQLVESRRQYVRRLLSPQAWYRLVTLQCDFRLMWRFLTDPLKKRAAGDAPGAPAVVPENDNANPLFPPAFFNMTGSKRPMLLVFGGSDRLQWEFEEKFVARYRDRLAQVPDAYDVHVIKDANHVLSLREWQNEMLEVSARWLRRHFADALGHAEPARHSQTLSVAALSGGALPQANLR